MRYCTSCGGELRSTAHFCPQCGAATPPETPGPVKRKGYAVPGATGAPLSPSPPGPRRTPTAAPVLAVVAIACAAVVGLGAVLLLTTRSDPQETATESSETGATNSPTVAPTTTPTTEALDTRATPGGLPGHWVAFLGSYRSESDARATLGSMPSGASVLFSNDYTSLNRDYWVVFVDDGFTDGPDAWAFCQSVGRADPDLCHGRFLSTSPAADPNDTRGPNSLIFPPLP